VETNHDGGIEMRIRTFLQVFSMIVMVIALFMAAASGLDLGLHRADATVPFLVAIGAMLFAGLLWMLTEISEQLAELPQDLAEYGSVSASVDRCGSSAGSASRSQSSPQPHA
jgi:hypothetical protein